MSKSVGVSFEFFPPADEVAAGRLEAALARLAPLAPRFVSVTHGADGSSRERTMRWVGRIRREWSLSVVPHLAGAGIPRSEVQALTECYWREGFRRLIVLRGDPPNGGGKKGDRLDYRFASELITELRERHDFELTVAAYPEGHPDTGTVEADIDNLKRKVDAGASRAITQFFFDVDSYLRYRDRCRAAGISIPIIPGVLPIRRFAQVCRFAERCGASVPVWLRRRFEGLDGDPETTRLLAAHVAIEQVRRLIAEGADEVHFYTLNHADLTYAVCRALGLGSVMTASRVA